MNTAVLIGNLTKAPEEIVTADGLHIATFTVAAQRTTKDKDGRYKADFVPVKVMGKRAEVCTKYLDKGSKVGVRGMISSYSYTGQDGSKRFRIEVLADNVEFLMPKGQQSHNDSYSGDTGDESGYTDGTEDDELPF